MYNRKIGFRNMTESTFYGPFKIANLVIWIWAERNQEGQYSVQNFFSPRHISMFTLDDTECKNPIPVSQFLFLDKSAFTHTSNMNYELMYQDIIQKDLVPEIVDRYVFWLLDILSAYDEQNQKDPMLLEFAEKICDWLRSQGIADEKIMLLNKMQIVKRQRKLTPSEIVELAKLKYTLVPPRRSFGVSPFRRSGKTAAGVWGLPGRVAFGYPNAMLANRATLRGRYFDV